MTNARNHLYKSSTVIRYLIAGVAIVVLWMIFTGGFRLNEMLVGVPVVIFSMMFLFLAGRTEGLDLEFCTMDLLQGWRIPWYIVNDGVDITSVLLADLAGIRRASSYYRVLGFRPAGSNPRFAAEGILAIAYMGMSPNSVVIGIDERRQRMLFHQLKRNDIPQMTLNLGARYNN